MDEQAKLLVQTYLVTALVPDISHPIPVISGQGAAKSTFSRVLRRLIDPAHAELLSLPTDQNELAVALARNYLPAFDNLDGMQPWQSDMLCRASTGGGISKRRLYTDDAEVVLSFRRCMVLNGIQPGVTRPDLLDRTIPFHLERMEAGQRKEEGKFWADFEEARPWLVGAMFSVLAKAMCLYPNVHLSALPRMADFCRWGYAVAEAWARKAPHFSRPTRARSMPRTRRPSRTRRRSRHRVVRRYGENRRGSRHARVLGWDGGRTPDRAR